MNINDCVEMTMFLCLTCFLFMQKMHYFRDKCIFAFYAEIRDGHQKWQENNFWKKSSVHSADALGVKTFANMALSRTISEIFKIFYFHH